jgi:hAT family C-terminal dimerisation region
VHKYTAVVGVLDDPLAWWQKNNIQFPYLSQFSKVQLSFMATSASVERHFSKCGVLITKQKANLNPINIQKILFIHEYYDLVNKYINE